MNKKKPKYFNLTSLIINYQKMWLHSINPIISNEQSKTGRFYLKLHSLVLMWSSKISATYTMSNSFQTGKPSILSSATMSVSCQEGINRRSLL